MESQSNGEIGSIPLLAELAEEGNALSELGEPAGAVALRFLVDAV